MNCVDKKNICLECGKMLEEAKDCCDECLLDKKLEAEIMEYEKQIEL